MSNPPDQVTITVSRNELEALLRRIVREELTRLLGPEHPATLGTAHNLAGTLDSQGDYAGAQESPLGQRLRSIRAEIVASGAPLLDRTSLAAEVAERRGER